jgi:FRG domain
MALSPTASSRELAESWSSFLDYCNRRSTSDWVFRGLASDRYELKPKVGRVTDSDFKALVRAEKAIFAKFKRQMAQFEQPAERDDWSLLALAQHHGLPTRLLDWSTSPLVAGYFAVSSPPVDTDAVVVAVRTKSAQYVRDFRTSPFDAREIAFFSPPSVSPRIVNQRGLFSVHPEPWTAWEQPLERSPLRIPAAHKPFFRRRLFAFGVDPLTIETGLDGLCHTLEWQYFDRVGLWLEL